MTAAGAEGEEATSVRCRHTVGRADLVELLYRLGADPETAAALTGFVPPDTQRALWTALTRQEGKPPAQREQVRAQEGRRGEAKAGSVVVWRAARPRVTVPSEQEVLEMPAVIRQAALRSELDFAADPSFIPPRPRPLLRKSRLVPVLRRITRLERPGPPDEARLVAQLARGLPLRRVPRRTCWGWPVRLQLYWDRSVVMQPCWHDQYDVAEWLRRWHGRERLEEIIVHASGLAQRYPSPGRLRRGPPKPTAVKPPDAATLLLVLGDLGAADADPRRQALWRERARRARRAGATCHALLLCPGARVPRDLVHVYEAVDWERGRRVRATSARDAAMSERRQQARDRVLTLLSEAVRVEPGLLRAVRLLLPHGEGDLGTELDVWMDERVRGRSPRALTLGPQATRSLQSELARYPAQLQQSVHRLLDVWHRGLSPIVRAEELARSSDAERRSEGLRMQAEYVKHLLTRNTELEAAERAYVDRFTARQHEADWQCPQKAALWALRHRFADAESSDQTLPEGLSLSQVSWLLGRGSDLVGCRLWQSGPRLYLLPLRGPSLAPPLPDEPGSHLLDLPCSSSLVRVEWRGDELASADSPEAWASSEPGARLMTLTQAVELRLPADERAHALRLHVETDRAEVELLPQGLPDWSAELLRERHALRLEGVRELPVVGTVKEPLSWPPWATRLSHDRFGLLAELELAPDAVVRLRWVPAGKFGMGSPEGETGRYTDEGPMHEVVLSRGYWMSETACTQRVWESVMGTNPSHFRGSERPVERVSWAECEDFCGRLNGLVPGLVVRLPTEAEWEYACRAGSESAYNDGSACTEPHGRDGALDRLGWYNENSGGETHDVKQLEANAWGLYDLHGNVWEWCQDWYGAYTGEAAVDPRGAETGRGRVVRGGGFDNHAGDCRSAGRDGGHPDGRYRYLGFRFVSQESSEGAESESSGADRAAGSERGASRAEPAASARGWWQRLLKK